jgi:hypothetical protein
MTRSRLPGRELPRTLGRKLLIALSVALFGAATIGILAFVAMLLIQTKPIWFPLAVEAASSEGKDPRAETQQD